MTGTAHSSGSIPAWRQICWSHLNRDFQVRQMTPGQVESARKLLKGGMSLRNVAENLGVLDPDVVPLAARIESMNHQARGPGRMLNISPGEDCCFLLRCYRNPYSANEEPTSMFPPLGPLSQPLLASLFLASLGLTLVLMLAESAINQLLVNATATGGIVSLQLARKKSRVQEILNSWDDEACRGHHRALARLPVPAVLRLGAVLGCLWSRSQFLGLAWLALPATVLAWLAILGGLFDAVENVALLIQLYRGPREFLARLAFNSAIAKFALAGLALAYITLGVIAWLAGGLLVRSQIAATLAGFAALFLLYRRSLPELVRFALGHPAVIAAALVTYGFVFGMLGTGNGIQYLFWHDRWLARISASVGATLLLADLGVIAYYASPHLVEALIGPPTEDGSPITVGRSARRLRRFLMVGGAPLLLLLVAPALFPAAFPGVPRPADSCSAFASWAINLVCWCFGVAGGVAILLGLLEVSPIIHRFFSKFGTKKVVDVRVSVATFYAAFVVFYVLIAWPFDALVSPAFAICALLGLLSMSNAFVAFYSVHINPRFGRWAVPPSAILAVALVVWFGLANRDPYKLRFPEMADYYPGGASGPVDLPKAVAEQYDQDRGPQPVPPGQAVLVDDATALEELAEVRRGVRHGQEPDGQAEARGPGRQRGGLPVGLLGGGGPRADRGRDRRLRRSRPGDHRGVGRDGRRLVLPPAEDGPPQDPGGGGDSPADSHEPRRRHDPDRLDPRGQHHARGPLHRPPRTLERHQTLGQRE